MNVSELIKGCRTINDPYLHKPFFDLIANILEQQQAEIEALKKENEELSALCVEFNVLRKAQEK